MQENRHNTSWNPQIAIAVVAVGVIAAVWLNMAKLKMGMGQPQHDISQVPIAQNVTSDEIEQLRNGKPLELILSERPDYTQLAASAGVRKPETPLTGQPSASRSTPSEAQTVTSLTKQTAGAAGQAPPTFSNESPREEPPASLQMPPETDGKDSFRLPLRDPAVAPVGFSDRPPEAVKLTPTPDDEIAAPAARSATVAPQLEFTPEQVPRANPTSGFNAGGGGSFLEKFPGQSTQLPNLKHGPAQNPQPQPLVAESTPAPPVDLPTATELTPPPFGDFAPATPEPLANAQPTSAAGAEFKPASVPQPNQNLQNQPAPLTGNAPAANLQRASSVLAKADKKNRQPGPAYPTIVIEAGETWWTLAQRVYDDGQLFRELYEFNRDQFPDYNQLPAGRQVICPPREVLRQQPEFEASGTEKPAEIRGRRYQVRKGETLFEIARSEMGQASRFAELLELNRKRLPAGAGHLTPLPAGTELLLPPH